MPTAELRETVQYEPPPGIHWDDATYTGQAYPCFGWAGCLVDVEVDLDTHQVAITRCVHAVDVGKAINPVIVAGQIEGGTRRRWAGRCSRACVYKDGKVPTRHDQLHRADLRRRARSRDHHRRVPVSRSGPTAPRASARSRWTARRPRSPTRCHGRARRGLRSGADLARGHRRGRWRGVVSEPLTITVNGSLARVEASPWRRLLDVLREDLRLTGTKEGCGEGECGACTVLLDGAPVNSCLVASARPTAARSPPSRGWPTGRCCTRSSASWSPAAARSAASARRASRCARQAVVDGGARRGRRPRAGARAARRQHLPLHRLPADRRRGRRRGGRRRRTVQP
jgi:hypothetical protein